MDANDQFIRDADAFRDAQDALADMKDNAIGSGIAYYWQSVTADDLRAAFQDEHHDDYHTQLTAALRASDDAEIGRLVRRIVNSYFTTCAEIDWESRNG